MNSVMKGMKGEIRIIKVVLRYLVWNIGMEIYGDVLAVGLMIKAH